MSIPKEDNIFEQVVQKMDPQSKLLCDPLLKLPTGDSTIPQKKPCAKGTDGSLARHLKSYPPKGWIESQTIFIFVSVRRDAVH